MPAAEILYSLPAPYDGSVRSLANNLLAAADLTKVILAHCGCTSLAQLDEKLEAGDEKTLELSAGLALSTEQRELITEYYDVALAVRSKPRDVAQVATKIIVCNECGEWLAISTGAQVPKTCEITAGCVGTYLSSSQRATKVAIKLSKPSDSAPAEQ